MKQLVVSTFPPIACGIGRYAAQQVAALRSEGHIIDVLSPHEGDGDWRDNLFGGVRPLRLMKYLWAYDHAYIHFTPFFFYDGERTKWNRLASSMALLMVMLLFGRRITMLIHETPFSIGQTDHGLFRYRIDRWIWRLAGRVIVHTARERVALLEFYRLPEKAMTIEIWPPDKYYRPYCQLNREEARHELSIPPDQCLLLCIGFIQQHKGFDRAMRVFSQVPDERLMLKVVGSIRLDWDQVHRYAIALHEWTRNDPRCEVIESFITDELFDQWLVAADYIILPYQEINTSGVAARARLYGRPVIVANTGALAEQAQMTGSHVFRDEAELLDILTEISENFAPSRA